MNEESIDPIEQNEGADRSRHVELRGNVAWDIAKNLEKPPLDDTATEQERADREALEAVRGKFVDSFAGETGKGSVSVPLAGDEIELIKKNMPQPSMGPDSRIQHEMLTDLESGYRTAGQDEWIHEKTSGFFAKAKQLLVKLLFR